MIEERGFFLQREARNKVLGAFLDRLVGIEINGFNGFLPWRGLRQHRA